MAGALAAMIGGGATGRRADAREDAAIRRLEEAYDAAWNAGDLRGLVALFARDAVLINPRGQIARGRAEVEQVMRRFLGGPANESTHTTVVEDVHFLTDDVAIVDGRATLEGLIGPDGGSEPPLVHRFTDVMTRTDGSWSIAHVRGYVFMSGAPGELER